MGRTQRTIIATGAALLLGGAVLAPSAAASATVASCPTGWGSLPKYGFAVSSATIHNIRTGHHPCFDRVVIDLNGAPDGYHISYTSRFLTEGEGREISTRGGAKLLIVVDSPAYDPSTGEPTYLPTDPLELIPHPTHTLRQGVWLGSFEGQTSIGIGTRARLPYRAFVLNGPGADSRLIVDVAHTW